MQKIVGFLIINLLLVSQGNAADTTVIAAFGDSLTAGYGLEPDDAFPAQLEKKLIADGYKVQVLNDGISNDTSGDGLTRIDPVLQQKPDLVIVEFGGNDLLRALPPADTRKNVDAMMAKFKEAKIKMILTGQRASLSMGTVYLDAYNSIFTDLAKTYNVPVYPFFLREVYGNAALMQEDGIHPNKDGIAKIVIAFASIVEQSLKK